MRKVYLNNYWALFLDFVKNLNNLTYNNVSLPLLCNFYQYLDEELKKEMLKPAFKDYLNTKQITEEQIQPSFERLLLPVRNAPRIKPLSGKVLLNYNYLRFSVNNYLENFTPQETLILGPWRLVDFLGIQVHCLENYKQEVTELKEIYWEKASLFLQLNKEHVLFNNRFFCTKFLESIPRMVETLVAVDKFLEGVSVSCVIVGTTEDMLSRILTIVAAQKGIPSICLQHGAIMDEEGFMPVFASKMAVYGQYEKEWYIKKGVSEDRIAITGHPRYDDIFSQGHMSKMAFQEKYDLDPQKKWVLFATQAYNDQLWNPLIELLAQEQQIEVIIKPHPYEMKDSLLKNYKYFSEKYPAVKLILEKEISAYDILSNVDAVVVNQSTIGLEAMLFDKPVFFLNNKDYGYYEKMDMFVQRDPAIIAQLIKRLFSDENLRKDAERKRKEFLLYTYTEQISSKKLLELIHNLTGLKKGEK